MLTKLSDLMKKAFESLLQAIYAEFDDSIEFLQKNTHRHTTPVSWLLPTSMQNRYWHLYSKSLLFVAVEARWCT
jgi:hypothetical protein